MLKNLLSFTLIASLISVGFAPLALGSTREEKQARAIEKLKAALTKLGTGPDARIKVELRDNRKLRGYVSQIREGDFMVVDSKTGTSTTVTYAQVKQVKGNNLSTGAKVAIVAAVIVGVIVLGFLFQRTER